MSSHVGRHRAKRRHPLRRPSVAATATLSALAVSAAGYSAGFSFDPAVAAPEAAMGMPRAHSAGVTSLDENATITAKAKARGAREAASRKARGDQAKRTAAARAKSAKAAKARTAAIKNLDARPTEEPRTEGPDRASRDAERPVVTGDPRTIARGMLSEYGWGQDQFGCLDQLWVGESNWRVNATNPTSGAYGIPQSLPAGKMASAGPDWRTNPATQIEWGLTYIKQSYGSPCGALAFWNSKNPHWY